MPVWAQVVMTILVGGVSAALGGYLMWRSTDKRRRRESQADRRKLFLGVKAQAPQLIKLMDIWDFFKQLLIVERQPLFKDLDLWLMFYLA